MCGNANRPRQPVRDVRIDYSKRWQHQHWGALVASYKGSPYFDFYAEYFEPFYRREYGFLADYNAELLGRLCSLLNVPMPEFSQTYVDAARRRYRPAPQTAQRGPGVHCRALCARSSPTVCLSSLICRLRICCSPRALKPFRF